MYARRPPQHDLSPMNNVFDSVTVAELTARINRLTPSTMAQWGKMSVRKLPRQAHRLKSDSGAGFGALGRNVDGGTRPRASWARTVL